MVTYVISDCAQLRIRFALLLAIVAKEIWDGYLCVSRTFLIVHCALE
jgi:hypothetical protein